MNFNNIFDYNPITGELIRKQTTTYRSKKGDVVGYDDGRGYLRVNIKGKLFYVHRIVWELSNGAIPDTMMIDHIDGDRSNNKLENLRLVNSKGNARNKRKYLNTESGVFGVLRTPENRWHARIKVNSQTIHLGNYQTLAEAKAARRAAEICFDFHKNHGKIAIQKTSQAENRTQTKEAIK